MTSRYDVIMIGSGISSLTCAAILAKKGKSVLVLESHAKPGGYLHCFNRFGVRFDTGAHYVGAMDPGQPFHTLLNYVGAYDENLFVPLDPDGFDVLHYPEMTVEIPKGYAAVMRRLSSIFPGEAGAIENYFSQVRRVAENFPTYEFHEDADMAFIGKVLETSLESVVKSLTQNQALQAVLCSYCTLHGVEPPDVSFGMHAIVTDSLIRGPYGLAQGGDGLARKYVAAIETQGGQVKLRTRVNQIEIKDKLATAVITESGERFEAEWIISGIHPKATFQLVSDQSVFSPAFKDRVARIRETDGIFGIYAAGRQPRGMSTVKNYYYFGSLEQSRMLTAGDPHSMPHSIFVSPAERRPANVSPSEGATPVTATRPFAMNIHAAGPMRWFEPWRASKFAKRPDEYTAMKAGYADQVLTMIERYQPDMRRSVDKMASSSPLTNLHFNGSPEGSPYGIYHSIQNTGARALGPRTHVANLLLTGQSCLFPGLLGAAIAGLRTSGHIVGIKPILKELRAMGQSA